MKIQVTFEVEDVMAAQPGWPEAHALEFMERNRKYIEERLSEVGFEVISDLAAAEEYEWDRNRDREAAREEDT